MTTLSDLVVSRELAERMRAAGWEHETAFVWADGEVTLAPDRGQKLIRARKKGEPEGPRGMQGWKVLKTTAAPTAGEILEALRGVGFRQIELTLVPLGCQARDASVPWWEYTRRWASGPTPAEVLGELWCKVREEAKPPRGKPRVVIEDFE